MLADMKIQMIFDAIDFVPTDEIIGIAPFRDKLVLATSRHLFLIEHDEETQIKIRQLALLHGDEFTL